MKGNHLAFVGRSAPRIALALLVGLGLTACGGGGSSAPPPTVSLAVQPTSIALGQSAKITWSSNPGDSCSASGGWSGAEPDSGSLTVTPTAAGAITYALMCTGGAYSGSTTQSATLTVVAPSAYSFTSLVADTAGTGALTTDANLVNPWGIAFGTTSPVWVANNHSETSTVYDGNGKPQPLSSPRVVALAASASGVDFDPTGIVFNSSSDFVVSSGDKTGPAAFIFDGEGGMIAGWPASVGLNSAVTMYVDAGGAVYKGLAIANNGSGNFLYATDFNNGKIDVFDATFTKQTPSDAKFSFKDPTLPADYAPFGIQAIKNGPGGTTQLYVTYAKKAAPGDTDEEHGAGLGLVDVFDANGNLVTHLVAAGGLLDAPWGMVLAPSDFGTLSGALLVGNFGDGRINGFDPVTGAFLGTISDASNAPFQMPGLWGIAFGNDASNQPHNTLFFAAGTNDEANGVYGRIDLGAAPPVLSAPPVVALSVPTGNLSGTVALAATVQDAIKIAKVEFFLNGSTSLGVATSAPYSVQWDTTKVADGTVTLTATATDIDNGVGTSPAVTATVANGSPPAAVTLTQLQSTIFTPRCSGCHNGSQPPGGSLPGSQNLTAGNSFASLVNVPSLEQPSLLRVKPGDPDNSYLIRKLEGTAGISGSRMPLGGPFLDQATIDQVRSWIAAGAPNN
ncbi:MAG: TIGR03118 family protein [Gemmatimonadota bacterium]